MVSAIEFCSRMFNLFRLMIFRDLVCAILFFLFQIRLHWAIWKNKVMIKYFDENVKKFGEKKIALKYENESYTFQDLANLSNKISNWIETTLQLGHDDEWELQHQKTSQEQKLHDDNNQESKLRNKFHDNLLKSTQIGLMFGNTPELICFIIGIARVRCSSVLFNTNHRRDTLLNAFEATNCRVFIFESRYLSAIQDIVDELPENNNIKFFMYDRNERAEMIVDPGYYGMTKNELKNIDMKKSSSFASILNSYPVTKVRKNYPYKFSDMIHFMFTSGTTGGKIKSVPVDNVRYIGMNLSHRLVFGLKESDNIYICLPCYHGFAGVAGLGSLFITGNTITLTEKFSARKFWSDCRRNGCTVALYIGEICRYLLAQPEHPDERNHSLRMLFGIGLNRASWPLVKKRFNIPKICEFYASTEGNILIANHQNVEGSCGFIPWYFGPLLHTLWPCHLIKVDPVTLELERNPRTGLCRFARSGDLGMLVGEIRPGQVFTEYLGYTSPEESSKKLIRNVRRRGDFVFVSGDILEMDFYGNLYFKDRTGDTFRWKGENVSTTEIETILMEYLNHQDCVVYGVTVPKCEGRAGMMALCDQNIDLERLYEYMEPRIPEYAIPKFIRITDKIETTSTHKYIKYSLREQGIDLNKINPNDRIFYFDRQQKKYLPMDRDAYQKIQSGAIQF